MGAFKSLASYQFPSKNPMQLEPVPLQSASGFAKRESIVAADFAKRVNIDDLIG